MLNTITIREQIVDLNRRMPDLQRNASAELDLRAANVSTGRFEGACELRDAALEKLRDLERALRGVSLQHALTELTQLDSDLATADEERKAADRVLAEMAQLPIVQKWLSAPNIACRFGYGFSWGTAAPPYTETGTFTSWYLSNRPRHFGLSEGASWFLTAECPEPLRFDLQANRAAIIAYIQQRDECVAASIKLNTLADRRQRLLAQHPELASQP